MRYIDLFAGCGGLSLGLERAGFELVLAVEKSTMASQTFYHNLIKRLENDEAWRDYEKISIKEQFKGRLITKELSALLNDNVLMKELNKQKIDLVVGGPPCQGFSLAGRRNPNDARNQLSWQYLKFVEKINPKAVVIENVVGIDREFKKHGEEAPFKQLQQALRKLNKGYIVQPIHINAIHYGVPEHRPRLMILGLRKDIANAKGIKATDDIWNSVFADELDVLPDMAPAPTTKRKEARTLRDAIADLSIIETKKLNKSTRVFLKEMQDTKLWNLKPLKTNSIPNHNNRNHQRKVVSRFKLYQYLGNQRLSSNILNIPERHDFHTAHALLNDLLQQATLPAYSSDNTLLAKNKKMLIELIFELKTKKHSQRPLNWDQPSPTVVTIPDDYVHPYEPRTLTVRELARLQSFPDAFEFKSKETTGGQKRSSEVPQYSQVGNAVAPLVAYSVGKVFHEILDE